MLSFVASLINREFNSRLYKAFPCKHFVVVALVDFILILFFSLRQCLTMQPKLALSFPPSTGIIGVHAFVWAYVFVCMCVYVCTHTHVCAGTDT